MVAQRAPALGDAGYSPGDPIAFVATTRFDVWGSTATTVDPPRAALGFEVPAGPNYGIVLLVSAVLLAGAALTTALPGRFGWSRLLALGAPVAGGALAGVAACQLLAFQATSRSSTADGADVVAAILRPEWRLGLSPWLTTAGAVAAIFTWALARPDPGTSPRPTPARPSLAVRSTPRSSDDRITLVPRVRDGVTCRRDERKVLSQDRRTRADHRRGSRLWEVVDPRRSTTSHDHRR